MDCGRQFSKKTYGLNVLPAWVQPAYKDYTIKRQVFINLQETYHKSPKTIRKYFDMFSPVHGEIVVPTHSVALIMDATYFGRSYGILVCRAESKNIFWKEIQNEKAQDYIDCVRTIELAGGIFNCFVIDGKRGVKEALLRHYPSIPVQYCQFHQLQTITQRLTKNPKLEPGKELRKLALTITRTTKVQFEADLQSWYGRWDVFLKERTYSLDMKRKWRYTHERLRSAFFSLQRNIPWLFTYEQYPHLHIPNTTNSCDGSFSHWKNKVKIHRKLAKQRRKKMIDVLLEQ